MRAVSGPGEKMFLALPEKADWLKTEAERLTVSCRVTLPWFQRVNLYIRQIMTLLRTTKTNTTNGTL